MALSVVAASKIEATTGTTVTAALTAPTTGNLMVGYAGGYQGTAGTASDSVNGSYTQILHTTGANGTEVGLYYKANITGGAMNGTVTATGATGLVGIFHEVAGASTTAPFTAGEATASIASNNTNPQTSSLTNSVANSIFFAAVQNDAGGNPSTMTINSTGTVGTWVTTSSTQSRELDGTIYPVADVVYQIVSSGAARVHGWTVTGNTNNALGIAIFGMAAGGATQVPYRRDRQLAQWRGF